MEYNHLLVNIENNVQDKTSAAWKKLCEYVELIAAEGRDEFAPYEYLGAEMYAQIHTLPETIAKLKTVKKIWLYGSSLKRIPPEIGQMEALEYFDPYTSYDLHWFPYEITRCKNLKDSRVSTRALYGNFKYRRPFPDLTGNPVRYEGDTVKCSICNSEMTWEQTNQFWISLWVGTDVLPLLVNVCSDACKEKLPAPPKNYIPHEHKGGKDLKQPLDEEAEWEIEWAKRQAEAENNKSGEEANDPADDTDAGKKQSVSFKDMKPLRLIRKIWEK